jgi:hypothetical protein
LRDDTNILIYTTKELTTRQLLLSDFDYNQDGNVVIDGEYDVPVKYTVITREDFTDERGEE